jgi:hypothetical protein
MWLLVGHRSHGRVRDFVELAVVAERLTLPREANDLERLAKAGLALAVGNAVGVVRADDATPTDPELEASLADVIERRDLFGDPERMIQGQDAHGGADAKPARARGDRARDLQRGGDDRPHRVEVDLAEPDAIDAQRLGALRRLEGLAERGRLAEPLSHLFDEDPEVHGGLSEGGQKKNVRFFANSTLWSRMIFRRAICQPPFTRRSRSSRLPTSMSVSVSTRLR